MVTLLSILGIDRATALEEGVKFLDSDNKDGFIKEFLNRPIDVELKDVAEISEFLGSVYDKYPRLRKGVVVEVEKQQKLYNTLTKVRKAVEYIVYDLKNGVSSRADTALWLEFSGLEFFGKTKHRDVEVVTAQLYSLLILEYFVNKVCLEPYTKGLNQEKERVIRRELAAAFRAATSPLSTRKEISPDLMVDGEWINIEDSWGMIHPERTHGENITHDVVICRVGGINAVDFNGLKIETVTYKEPKNSSFTFDDMLNAFNVKVDGRKIDIVRIRSQGRAPKQQKRGYQTKVFVETINTGLIDNYTVVCAGRAHLYKDGNGLVMKKSSDRDHNIYDGDFKKGIFTYTMDVSTRLYICVGYKVIVIPNVLTTDAALDGSVIFDTATGVDDIVAISSPDFGAYNISTSDVEAYELYEAKIRGKELAAKELDKETHLLKGRNTILEQTKIEKKHELEISKMDLEITMLFQKFYIESMSLIEKFTHEKLTRELDLQNRKDINAEKLSFEEKKHQLALNYADKKFSDERYREMYNKAPSGLLESVGGILGKFIGL